MWWSNAPPKEACFACSEFEKKFLHVFWGLDYYLCLMFWTFKSKLGIFSPAIREGGFLPMIIRLLLTVIDVSTTGV